MSGIQLKLNWNSLNKKRIKEQKKIDKLEKNLDSSLEFHYNKTKIQFKNERDKILKSLIKLKKDSDKISLEKELKLLEEKETEYYLLVINYVQEYEIVKAGMANPGIDYKYLKDKLEMITQSYFRVLNIEYTPPLVKDEYLICPDCGNEREEISPDEFTCLKCGITIRSVSGSCISYKESLDHDMKYDFSYKRMTHFQEWVNNFQAKENTDIPEEIINSIFIQVKQERIYDLSKLTNTDIKRYLKKLNFNKYYEHASIILNRINGIPPLRISQEIEGKLRSMFNKIQDPFTKHKPVDRKNFLSYAYVLRKFFELLDLKEYLIYFPLLKSREKVFTHDRIWKLICQDLNWNYIPSI